MAIFSFGLQKVLEYRRALVERLRCELASLERSQEQALLLLTDLRQAERSALGQLARQPNAALNIPAMIHADGHLDALRAQIADQVSVVQRVGQQLDAARADLGELAKSAKVLETLRDRQAEDHRHATHRRDQAELGEVAALWHRRMQVEE